MDLKEISHTTTGVNRHPWEIARLAIIKQLLKKIISKDEQVTLLDIGAGDLYVANSLAREFPYGTIIGVDTAYQDQSIPAEKNVIKYSNLAEIRNNRIVSVKIVLLLDVIEHIEDEIAFLNNLIQEDFISPDTKFIVTVPAYQSLFSAHDNFLGHYRRYTRQMLAMRLEEAGLKITSSAYFFFSLLFPRKLKQWLEKNGNKKNNDVGVGNWQGGIVITSIITQFLILDFKISKLLRKLGIRMPGLSLYAICQKSV